MTRLPLVPMAILASFFSFLTWLIGIATGTLRLELAIRFDHWLGWLSPEMDEHWERLNAEGPKRWFHNLKNITTEWTELDPQRASKFWAFLTVTGWFLAIVFLLF